MLAFFLALSLCDTDCDMCIMATDEIIDALKQGLSEDMIRQAAEAACEVVPQPYAESCKKFLTTLDAVLKDIRAGKSSRETCVDIGYCAKGVRRVVLRNDVTCHMSQEMVKKARSLAARNVPAKEAASTLIHQCRIFKDAMKTECERIVAASLPFAYVESLKNSQASKLGYCTPRQPKRTGGWITCAACLQVVQYIERQLEKGVVVEHITALVQEFCKKEFSESLLDLCNQLAIDYVPLICQWLDQELQTEHICTKLGYCAVPPAKKQKKVKANLVVANSICDTCKDVVAYIEQLLKDGKVEAEIIKLATQMCEKTPLPSVCVAVVQQYVPLIMELIGQGIETLDICVNIGLCAAKAK